MSMLPLLTGMLPLAEKTAEGSSKTSAFYVGGGALLIFMILLLAMLSFGKGREHS
ncbi:MAG TPA: hypothetical protein VFL69_15080 [Marmoricola sp.]|nr:hypothetical protein [Marmoricola sp.]